MPRRRSRRRRRKGSPGPLLRALSVVLMAVAIVAALTLFFKVEKVVVSGNSRYTEAEILAVTGVETGEQKAAGCAHGGGDGDEGRGLH